MITSSSPIKDFIIDLSTNIINKILEEDSDVHDAIIFQFPPHVIQKIGSITHSIYQPCSLAWNITISNFIVLGNREDVNLMGG